jgi:hypothetical protein
MPTPTQGWDVTRTPVDGINWTAIAAPFACDRASWVLEGNKAYSERLFTNSSEKQKTRLAGEGDSIGSATPNRSERFYRISEGQTVVFIKLSDPVATDTVVTTWEG